MLKRILNCPERITYHRLSEVCARRSAEVYAKVRLADVLPVEGSGLPQGLFEFALQAHYDFVITDLAQAPLFAVEFDGPQHHAPAQVERDAKKGDLSRRFGLPVVRVNAADLCRTEWRLDRLTEVAERWFDGSDHDQGDFPAAVGRPMTDPFAQGSDVAGKPTCPLCGSGMIVKNGKYGPFLSCVRFPACKGSCDLPAPSLGPRPRSGWMIGQDEGLFRRKGVIAGIIGSVLSLLLIGAIISWSRTGGPRASEQPPTIAGAAPATVRQMNFLGLLVRRRGWDATERDAQIEHVLGYNRKYAELSKQEASKLITAWDDRGK